MVKGSVIWTLLLLVVGLAGCVDGGEADLQENGEHSSSGNGGAGAGEQGDGGRPATPTDEDRNVTLEAPPRWHVGRWWDVRVSTQFLDHIFETRVVVAGEEGEWYLTGAADEKGLDDTLIMHLPGIGKIGKDDLRWDVHDEWFIPVRFPLEEGNTWETTWSTEAVTAEVTSVTGTRAEIEISGESEGLMGSTSISIRLVYDAEVATIVSMEIDGIASMEVIAHGFDHDGPVTVPYDYDLILFHGRLAGALGVGVQEGAHPPAETVSVQGDYDRAATVLFAYAVTPGHFMVDATAPNGDHYSLALTATASDTMEYVYHDVTDPAGDWELAFVTAGIGVVFIESFAYRSLTFDLPSGCLIDKEADVPEGEEC